MLKGFLVAMHDLPAEIRIEISGVPKHLQKAADTLLCLVLSLLLHVDIFVGLVQMSKYFVH